MLNPPLDPPCIATVDGYLERVNRRSNVARGRGDYSRSAGRHQGGANEHAMSSTSPVGAGTCVQKRRAGWRA
jgi:hypothetical protein